MISLVFFFRRSSLPLCQTMLYWCFEVFIRFHSIIHTWEFITCTWNVCNLPSTQCTVWLLNHEILWCLDRVPPFNSSFPPVTHGNATDVKIVMIKLSKSWLDSGKKHPIVDISSTKNTKSMFLLNPYGEKTPSTTTAGPRRVLLWARRGFFHPPRDLVKSTKQLVEGYDTF